MQFWADLARRTPIRSARMHRAGPSLGVIDRGPPTSNPPLASDTSRLANDTGSLDNDTGLTSRRVRHHRRARKQSRLKHRGE